MRNRVNIMISLSAVTFLLVFPFLFTNPYPRHVMILTLMYIVLSEAWNLVGGYAGQWSLGHAAFFGIGGYVSSFLLVNYGVTPWIGMFVGALIAVLFSIGVGFPCFKLKRYYFAIATLVLAAVARIAIDFYELTYAEHEGLILPSQHAGSLYYLLWNNELPYYFYILALLAFATFIIYVMTKSKLSIYLRAIKSDEVASESLGLDTHKYKLLALVISCFLTSLAGTFFAQYLKYTSTSSTMTMTLSVQIMLMPILGGLGTFLGPVVGGLIMVPLSEFIRVYAGKFLAFSSGATGIDMVVYGLIVLFVSMRAPKGVMGIITERIQRMKRHEHS